MSRDFQDPSICCASSWKAEPLKPRESPSVRSSVFTEPTWQIPVMSPWKQSLNFSFWLPPSSSRKPGLSSRMDEGLAAGDGEIPDDGDVLEKISRYRPYRIAAGRLQARKERQDRIFLRRADEEEEEEQFGNLGDLYALCRQWWDILEFRRGSLSRSIRPDFSTSGDWDGFPSPLPEEEQIERKISEILARLAGHASLRFSQLLDGRENVTLLVVTLLALLEMARMGRIRMEQEDLFHDVIFYAL